MREARGGVVAVLLVSLIGCATPPSQRTFDAPPERIREAAKLALSHCPGLREVDGVILTGYCSKPITPKLQRGNGGWRESHEVRIVGQSVEVNSTTGKSGPYGHGAHRWERRDSQEVQEAVLEAIARRLKEIQ